ncbi:bifunctional diaminohydroxyphosphoribosylaminopyrimidine deaminase/5-amino-6-(5-phosphoribosylamino)uracil reductase RibD [Rheinheimera sp. D18]|uniref:bifunctional diaminohydroxyphosphoribosylaminopyrimidine deaminase/5-amino-6-(5-phosphoribosylamino)uracil reductase RibD n=1 Tax=Rheinheimera sp. D18 TaxID=2545632 RepID=UPI00104B8C23|nr:bifunctional diaminohydroxyphosphoribosylaminopyrimidine deaminase/5-amino-6-(5-phosphoribosylamino)uracil reductase RibD [Rheinheimera sp. D18]QBL08965.1 bifunctional diaminohydroxyphosphoribosylaminopyrimidine deaminase/5-amino-6-(5-phosphoribosylamino)uracil reductase RibD [Rheinheimera sp. D18]
MFSCADYTFMAEAIQLAERGCYTTTPNPNVGALVVKKGQVIGRGYHQQAGGAHAEVFALQQAGAAAKGATCYVTLEPCSHYGKTPPCAQALIDAGVAQVIVAMTDPNPSVAGKGIAMLRAAGIKVEVGLLETQARALNPGFLSRMERNRPYVQLKLAASLDGRTALANGDSKWLTGEAARADVQHYRAKSCAVLSTATTVMADNARLTLRKEQLLQDVTHLKDGTLRQPKRVILDRNGILDHKQALFTDGGEVLLCVSKLENDRQLPNIARQIHCQLNNQAQFDLGLLLTHLAVHEGINNLWVEAGATLAGTLLQLNLVDELIVYIAPKLLGNTAQPLAVLPEFTALSQVPELSWTDIRMVGQDIRLTAKLT